MAEVVSRFEKEIWKKESHPTRDRYHRSFNKMMDEYERTSLNPSIDYVAKWSDE